MASETKLRPYGAATPRYIAAPGEALAVREVEDLYLVYDRRSGETHVLAPDIFAILGTVQGRTLTPAEVLAALAEAHDIEIEAGEALDIVAARLAELAVLGLADEAA